MTLKHLLLAALMLAAPWAQAADVATPLAAKTITGEVLETKDVDNYTYLHLKTKDGEHWAAVNQSAVKKGSKVTISNVLVMENFESTTLKKTFPVILFGTLGTSGDAAAADPHAGMGKLADIGPIKVVKASGANAYTVSQIIALASKLKDKSVRVSGKVVKYNGAIMGKNWLHLQDGTGPAAANDILVTSAATAKVGDVVTAVGTVRTNKDFGAGYTYKVLIEDAELKP